MGKNILDNLERGSQLKGYIQREIKQHPMHSNYGYNYYFCRSFLERLYHNNESFVLRGSFSQLCNLREIIRPVTDIDIVTYGDIEKQKNILEKTLNEKGKINYEIKNRFVTTNATINYRILCHFDEIKHLISIDLKKDSNIDSKENIMPNIFSKDNEYGVNTITLEEHLANKLYISLLNLNLYYKLGKNIRRFKDFYDIYNILQRGNIDIDKVKDIFNKKIKEDEFLKNYKIKNNLFDNDFIKENQALWNEDKKKYEFNDKTTLESAIMSVEENIRKMR